MVQRSVVGVQGVAYGLGVSASHPESLTLNTVGGSLPCTLPPAPCPLPPAFCTLSTHLVTGTPKRESGKLDTLGVNTGSKHVQWDDDVNDPEGLEDPYQVPNHSFHWIHRVWGENPSTGVPRP